MDKIVITVRGGNVDSVHATIENLQVILLDYDNFEHGEKKWTS